MAARARHPAAKSLAGLASGCAGQGARKAAEGANKPRSEMRHVDFLAKTSFGWGWVKWGYAMRTIALALLAAFVASSTSAKAQDFSGYYAGVFGSVGSSGSTFYGTASDPIVSLEDNLRVRMDSPSIGAFGGYNFQQGNVVYGFEASAEFGVQSADTNTFVSRWTGGPYDGGEIREWAEFRQIVTPVISGRVGVALDRTLFYARGGIGGSRISAKYKQQFSSYYMDETYSSSTERTTSKFAPLVEVALGAEYHAGQYFGRIEAEVSHLHWGSGFMPSGKSGATQYRVNLGVGVKF